MINDLTKTTFCHYSRPRNTGNIGEEIRSLYEELATRNNPSDPFLPVFTTNYDLLPEDIFAEGRKSQPQIPFFNGIPGRTRKGSRWTPKAYESRGINLYRLHGCVSWFNESTDGPVSFARPEEINGDLLSKLCVMFPGRELETGRDPHGFGFKLLHSALLSCRSVLFIGFSFRDDDIMHILLAANAFRREPMRIFVVDPRNGRDVVLKNLRSAARRSTFHVRLPQDEEIACLDLKINGSGVKDTILDFTNLE